jgi:hypothetical protein
VDSLLIQSPSLKVCVMKPNAQACIGCGRTLAEIAHWSRMGESERTAITALLPGRLRELSLLR